MLETFDELDLSSLKLSEQYNVVRFRFNVAEGMTSTATFSEQSNGGFFNASSIWD